MCVRSASINLAVLVAAYGLLAADGAGDAVDEPTSLSDDPRCLPHATSRVLNGSLSLDYPAELHSDGNVTYNCVCRSVNCIKKCCHDDEVLHEDARDEEDIPRCQKMLWNYTEPATRAKTPDLRLSRDQMIEEIQRIENLQERFLLVREDDFCPGQVISFDPDQSTDDAIVLQTNGSIMDADKKIVPFWNYCIDWKVTVGRIGILICPMQSVPNDKDEPLATHHHVGIMVSIPFLIVTFLVYAITPELRNLYGKTLMCYVICLIIAYVLLILVNYIYLSSIPVLCVSTGKPFAYVSLYSCNNRFRVADLCSVLVELKNINQFEAIPLCRKTFPPLCTKKIN